MSTTTATPVDNLVRAVFGPETAELRAKSDTEDGGLLHGHFAVFNKWTEIDSMREGHFMERIVPGAFVDTFAKRGDQIKVLYDHGQDPQLGNKPLGAIRSLEEDRVGARYEVDLLRGADGDLVPYNRDFIVPAAKANLLGASFRFLVTDEEWNDEPRSTKTNPDRLRERTITGAEVYEFGPVTFPAYEAASAQVRSGTDRWLDSLIHDPRFIARMIERVGVKTVEQIIAELPLDSDETRDAADGPHDETEATVDAADSPDDKWSPQNRRAALVARGLLPKD